MSISAQNLCYLLPLLLVYSGQAHAFGAGNIASISRIEGQNWRHGDIEDALLTLFLARVAGGRKFSKLDVQRVYFGNWLRDYSQAVDVGTLKYVSAEAIRILIWVLGFLSFGYGTKEFEVTTERLGCYEPTEHIDNPLGYAEGEDARDYDRRLRCPVDEERELSIDSRTGLKNYIATEDLGIATSAGLVRRVLSRSIQLGRQYARSRNDEDLHEAFRLLGTGLHCLEDYAAHSNYIELSLIEMGELDVFPHVGRNTKIELRGARHHVYPIVTGTFGGVDFFHSVLGELSDKATQSEVQSLEGVITESQNGSPSESFINDLLSKIPNGLIGDSEGQANKMGEFRAQSESAKEQSQNVSPREPEEWTHYLDEVHQRIYPVLEWHDEIIKSINSAIENIPVLPELVEQIQEQITVFVFSVLAPYVLPIIKQVKTELQTGSTEVIQSSREQQHIVFEDDDCSNPTHSMLSKDHFSNVLNEPAGRVASQVIKWTVPQLMECWDSEDVDITRTLDRIISGIFHHPALREYGEDGAADMRQIMFRTVEKWWQGKTEEEQEFLREQLTRQGVFEGKNHKEGVHDTGHGCGKPLALHKGSHSNSGPSDLGEVAASAASGGALGGLVSGLASSIGSMLLKDPESRFLDGCSGKDVYEHDDKGEMWEDRPNLEFEFQGRQGHGKPDDYNQFRPQSGSNSQAFRYESEETYRPGRGEYSDDNNELHYDHSGRDTRGHSNEYPEPRYNEYGGESTEPSYGYGNRPQDGDAEQQSYAGGRPDQRYAPQYRDTREDYDGIKGNEYSTQEEFGVDRYSSRNDEYTEREYGNEQRYDAEPRRYAY